MNKMEYKINTSIDSWGKSKFWKGNYNRIDKFNKRIEVIKRL